MQIAAGGLGGFLYLYPAALGLVLRRLHYSFLYCFITVSLALVPVGTAGIRGRYGRGTGELRPCYGGGTELPRGSSEVAMKEAKRRKEGKEKKRTRNKECQNHDLGRLGDLVEKTGEGRD